MPKTPTSLRLDPEVEQRLSDLVERTGRSKTYYITEAVRLHLEDLEDTYLAEGKYSEFPSAGWSAGVIGGRVGAA